MNSVLAHNLSAFAVNLLIKSTVLLLVALIAAFCLRRASAATRHLIWSVSLVGLLLLPLVSFTLPHWDIAVIRHSNIVPKAAHPPVTPKQPSLNSTSTISPTPRTIRIGTGTINITPQEFFALERAKSSPKIVPSVQPKPVAIKPLPVRPHLFLSSEAMAAVASLTFWLMGFLTIFIPLLFGLRQIVQIEKQSIPLEDETLRLADESQKALGLSRSVQFLRAAAKSALAIPVTWGLFQPRILLPPQSIDWSVACVRAALLHELAHVQRRDWTTQVLGRLACALYWWHPLVWLAAYQARAESERACDDCVLQAGVRAADYAERLVEVARSIPAGGTLRTVAITMAQPSEVEGRVKSVLARGRDRRPISPRYVFVFSVTLILILLPLSMLRLVARAQVPALPSNPQDWKSREQQTERTMKRISLAILEYQQDHDNVLPSLKSIALLDRDLEPYLKQQEKFPDPATHQPYQVHGIALFISPLTGLPYRLNTALSQHVLAPYRLYASHPTIAKESNPGAVHLYDAKLDVYKFDRKTYVVAPTAAIVLFDDAPMMVPGSKTQQMLEAFADGHVKGRTIMQATDPAAIMMAKIRALDSAAFKMSQRNQNTYDMKHISLAIQAYAQDHNEHLPSFRSITLLQRELWPYMGLITHTRWPNITGRYHGMFISTLSGKPYVFTTSLSSKPLSAISSPADTILFHDTPVRLAPGQKPVTAEAYADGHVKMRGISVPSAQPGKTKKEFVNAVKAYNHRERDLMSAMNSSLPGVDDRTKALAWKSMNAMKRIGLAIDMYAQDHTMRLPSLKSIALLEKDLKPYVGSTEPYLFSVTHKPYHVERSVSFASPLTGQPYRLNAALSNKSFTQFTEPAKAVLFSDTPMTIPPGKTQWVLEAFADGHVAIREMNPAPIKRAKTSDEKTKEQDNALNMQIIGLAVLRYAQDHHAVLPSFGTTAVLENDLRPYLQHPEVLFRTSQQRSHRIYPNISAVMPRNLFISPLTGQPYRLNASASHVTLSQSGSPSAVLLLSDLPTADVPMRNRLSLKAFPYKYGKPKQNLGWLVTIRIDSPSAKSRSALAAGNDITGWKMREQQTESNMKRISLAILEYQQNHHNGLPSLRTIADMESDLGPYLKQQERSLNPQLGQIDRGRALFISPLTGQPYHFYQALSHWDITPFKPHASDASRRVASPVFLNARYTSGRGYGLSTVDFGHPASLVLFRDTPTKLPGSSNQWVVEAFADGHVKGRATR